MGKVEIGIYFCVTADILKKVVLYQPYEFCINRWFWLVAMATKAKFSRKTFKNLLRSHKGDEAETLHNMTLASTLIIFFIVLAYVLSLLWQLEVSIYLLWEIVELSGNWHLFLLWQICFYWNVSRVVIYQPYEFCPDHWFWLVAVATESLNFLACSIYSILAEYSLHSFTFRWAFWGSGPMGL